MRIPTLICWCAMVLTCWGTLADTAFPKDGEVFEYGLCASKGLITISAGTATLSTTATNYQGRAALALELSLKSSMFVETFYHLRTTITSFVTPDLRPLAYKKYAEEGSRIYTEVAEFSPTSTGGCSVVSTRTVKGGRTDRVTNVRKRQVYDLVSANVLVRSDVMGHAVPGDRIPISVATGVWIRDGTIVCRGEETVTTESGENVPCRVFALVVNEGKLEKEVERAIFWLSNDSRRVPVRIDLMPNFGQVSVRLVRFR